MTTALLSGTIKKEAFEAWAQALVKAGYKVIAPVSTANGTEYLEYTQGPIAINAGLPKLSPKAAWFPRSEPVLSVKRDGKDWHVEDIKPEFPKVVILGARPCDAAAISVQRDLFTWDFQDEFFKKRTDLVTMVSVGCTAPVDKACFCTSVKINPAGLGVGDISIVPMPDGSFNAAANNEKGSEVLKLAGQLGQAASGQALEEISVKAAANIPEHFCLGKVHNAIENNFAHAIWEKTSQGCIGCGTCAFSCPVCHCFDLQDEMTGNEGLRQKNWDACTFSLFTLHTSGHNPRPDRAARWRQRVSHKFRIYPEKFHKPLCTGCGRCLRLCPGGLDLLDTLQQLDSLAEGNSCHGTEGLMLHSPGVMAGQPEGSDNLYRPYKMKVASVRDETRDVRTLRLEFADAQAAEAFDFKVGQFGLYSAFGEGESTFCIASSPARKGYLECTFRQAGRVTKGLRRLEAGDEMGFRGPYGNCFPVDEWKGKNLVFVGGGIGVAPVRAVLQYCIDHKEDFGKLTVVFGAKTWADHCYKGEMDEWRSTPNLDLHLCVDWTFGPGGPQRDKAAEEGWEPLVPGSKAGEKTTCFVPELVEAAGIAAENTVAIVCGPPIMINLSVKVLEKIGLSQENIYATLENRMKCGFGKCGRCNVGPVYVCKEGPVFTAAQLNALPQDT